MKTLNLTLVVLISTMSTIALAQSNPVLTGIEQMTPEEAHLAIAKLKSKSTEPLLPEAFYTKMAGSIQSSYHFVSESAFQRDLVPTHAENLKGGRALRAHLIWKLWDTGGLGFGFHYITARSEKSTAAGIFENASLRSLGFHLQFKQKVAFSEKWSMQVGLSLGGAEMSGSIETTNDTNSTTYRRKYSAAGPSAEGSLAFVYDINKVLGLGIEGGYLYGFGTTVWRSRTEVDAPADLGITGPFMGSTITFNL